MTISFLWPDVNLFSDILSTDILRCETIYLNLFIRDRAANPRQCTLVFPICMIKCLRKSLLKLSSSYDKNYAIKII